MSEVEKNALPVNLGENESALRCYVENEVNMIMVWLSISSPHTEFLTAGEKLEEKGFRDLNEKQSIYNVHADLRT